MLHQYCARTQRNGSLALQSLKLSISGGSVVKNSPANAGDAGRSLGQEDPLEKEMEPAPLFFPGESHGWRSLAGYSPWLQRLRHDWACMQTHNDLQRRWPALFEWALKDMESFAKHIKDRIGEEGGSRFTVRKQGVLSHIFATTLVELMEDHFDQLYIRMCMYWDRNLKKVDC